MKLSLQRFWHSETGFWMLFLQILAFWGVWRWYFLRVTTSADEGFGILGILAVILFAYKEKSQSKNNLFLIFSMAIIAVYTGTYLFLPPLLRAFLAMTALTFFISGWRLGRTFHFGIWTLLLLSLPLIASMQFYLGYPMRVIIGEATTFLLKLNGFSIIREGVSLHFGDKLIWIDAPCSGVKMLWTGFFLTAVLVTIYRFNLVKSSLSFIIAFGIILIGNIFRATGLFYLEVEIVKMPDFAHSGIGVISFVLTCVGIVFAVQKLSEATKTAEKLPPNLRLNKFTGIFFVACLAAFLIPFFANKSVKTTRIESVEFPQIFEGKLLREIGLSEKEKYFLEDFPGEIKRFTDGNREIIIRYVTEATRQLHTSMDCLSAIGFEINPLPLKIDEQNNKWACFRAIKGEEKLKVCERIYTKSGENWTDVSAWYWSALSDTNTEGYWVMTVSETWQEF